MVPLTKVLLASTIDPFQTDAVYVTPGNKGIIELKWTK